MAEIGKSARLEILKQSPQGLYLDGGPLGEILLPRYQVPDWAEVGETIAVFIYCDSEDRPIATTRTPLAQAGQFASLEVVSVHPKLGAFLDWGLDKDLLLPFREQKRRLRPGMRAVVYVYCDSVSQRVVASSRLRRYISPYKPNFKEGDEVDLIVFDETDLGFNAIVDGSHLGLLYKSELSEPLEYGQTLTGYIKAMRDDGKIDLRRDASGYRRVLPLAEDIFDAVVEADGYLPFNDRSSPEAIRDRFGASKKAFKQALGSLYKQRRIAFKDDGVVLVREGSSADSD